jgi:hypothetical protein
MVRNAFGRRDDVGRTDEVLMEVEITLPPPRARRHAPAAACPCHGVMYRYFSLM